LEEVLAGCREAFVVVAAGDTAAGSAVSAFGFTDNTRVSSAGGTPVGRRCIAPFLLTNTPAAVRLVVFTQNLLLGLGFRAPAVDDTHCSVAASLEAVWHFVGMGIVARHMSPEVGAPHIPLPALISITLPSIGESCRYTTAAPG
jgi:hypothetical protein